MMSRGRFVTVLPMGDSATSYSFMQRDSLFPPAQTANLYWTRVGIV